MQPQDKLKNTERDRSKFIVMIGDRKELNETKVRPMPHHRDKINCFTDGSKTERGAGNAYKIYSHDFNKGGSTYLGKTQQYFKQKKQQLQQQGWK